MLFSDLFCSFNRYTSYVCVFIISHWIAKTNSNLKIDETWLTLAYYIRERYWIWFKSVFLTIFTMRGREPWSIGYGKRLVCEGRGFESQNRILDFSHLFVVKVVMFVWTDEYEWKRGRGWHIWKKNNFTMRILSKAVMPIKTFSIKAKLGLDIIRLSVN